MVRSLLVLLDNLIARTGDLRDRRHPYQTRQCNPLGPHTRLHELLGERHGLRVDVRKDAAHARGPRGGDDAELVLFRPGERLVGCGERGPLALLACLVAPLECGAGVGVVRLVERDARFVGGDDAGTEGDGGDEEELDGGCEGAEGRPGAVEEVGRGRGERETCAEAFGCCADRGVVLTRWRKRRRRRRR